MLLLASAKGDKAKEGRALFTSQAWLRQGFLKSTRVVCCQQVDPVFRSSAEYTVDDPTGIEEFDTSGGVFFFLETRAIGWFGSQSLDAFCCEVEVLAPEMVLRVPFGDKEA